MNALGNIGSLAYFLPEIVLVGFILLVVLLDLVPSKARERVGGLTIAGLAIVLAILAFQLIEFPRALPTHRLVEEAAGGGESGRAEALQGSVIFLGAAAYDRFSIFFKLGFVAATLLVAVISPAVVRRWPTGRGEYYALLLSCLLGMMLMASARSLLMMYLALEFTSITSYILAGMLRRNRKSAEASLKYIIYGGGASGVMIFGMAYLYGMTGSLDAASVGAKIMEIYENLPAAQAPTLSLFALVTSVLVMAGFGYKVAAVPFHMWCPDVYEGAPTPVTAFFSVGPKAAGFAMLIRFLAGVFGVRPEITAGEAPEPFGGPLPEWTAILALLAVFTMAIGNFVAIHQQNLKRLLAYSSIAHAGYMLLAFTIFTHENIASLMFYVIVYIIMNLGAFFVVIVLEERHKIETVEGCAGLGWRRPGLCALMTIFLVSLTGLPPTAGFIGKFLIFGYLVNAGLFGIALAFVGVLFSAVSLYYYARIFMAMYLRAPASEAAAGEAALVEPRGGAIMPAIWLLAAATLIFGIFWKPIVAMALEAGRGLL